MAGVDWGAIRAVLFDKDGTLIDFASWLPVCGAAADALAREAGRPEAAQAMLLATGYDRRRGLLAADSALVQGTNREVARLWRAALGPAAPADLEAKTVAAFAGHAGGELAATADLPALFATLHGRGYALGIATNDDTRSARRCAERLGIAHYLAFVCGADGGYGGKPGPGMARAFCAAAGVAPGRAAMVGDSPADAAMARAAGFGAAVGVAVGGERAAALAPHVDGVLESVAGLPALLRGTAARPEAPGSG